MVKLWQEPYQVELSHADTEQPHMLCARTDLEDNGGLGWDSHYHVLSFVLDKDYKD
jgi:hypothetical protein